MNLNEMIKVLEAFKKKVPIQWRERGSDDKWKSVSTSCPDIEPKDPMFSYYVFNTDKWEFRVKPEPRTFYINIDEDGCIETYMSETEAKCERNGDFMECVKVREVVDE
jgi:hypothetical protein